MKICVLEPTNGSKFLSGLICISPLPLSSRSFSIFDAASPLLAAAICPDPPTQPLPTLISLVDKSSGAYGRFAAYPKNLFSVRALKEGKGKSCVKLCDDSACHSLVCRNHHDRARLSFCGTMRKDVAAARLSGGKSDFVHERRIYVGRNELARADVKRLFLKIGQIDVREDVRKWFPLAGGTQEQPALI